MKDMFMYTILLALILAAASLKVAAATAKKCNYAIGADTYPSDDFYFERTNNTANYTIHGFEENNGTNRDYYHGQNLFYTQYLGISDNYLPIVIKDLNCEVVTSSVDITTKVEGMDQQTYNSLFPNGDSWLCTVPEGLAVAGVRAQLIFDQDQIDPVGPYSLMMGIQPVRNDKDVKKAAVQQASILQAQVKLYNLTSLTFRNNIFTTNEFIMEYLFGSIESNTVAKVFTFEQMPNKILMIDRLYVILYTAGTQILVGRFSQANPNVVLIYSTQQLVQCKNKGGNLSKGSNLA